jgi:UDP-GlcNAc:undecaprenyl-phosphate GlcNAc-1-phosphate transferase
VAIHQIVTWLASVLGASFALSFVGTFVTRAITRRVGFVAKPRAERWHAKPTALAGGVGIFVAFTATSLVVGGKLELPLLIGAAAMFVLGFVDDVFHLKPYAKLVGQLIIAALTVLSGPSLPWTTISVVDQAISLFWIVGITNAVNLLDNMDGLAGGVACTGAAFLAVFFLIQHQMPQAACAVALAAALLGFLVFNWHPASIFMGDCGALFLGYTLASLAMQSNYGRSRGLLVTIAAPVLVMLVPIFDTTFVTLVRTVRGRPVSQGGRDHTSHRLVTLGLSERTAVTLLITVGVLGGITAVLARLNVRVGVWVGAPLVALTLAFLGIHLARTDRPAEGEGNRVNLLSALTAFGYRRRIFEVILDATLAMLSLAAAFLLRFDGDIPGYMQHGLARIFVVTVAAKLAALYVSRAYDGLWRYMGMHDILHLVRGAGLGTVVVFLVAGIWLRFQAISRGALLIDGVLFATLLVASRFSFRLLRTILGGRQESADSRTPALLWGAGDLGEALARRLLDDMDEGLMPVGFVDDDPLKRGRIIHGLRVHGDSQEIAGLLDSGTAAVVLITSPRILADRVAAVAVRVGKERLRRVRLLVEEVDAADPGSRAEP